MGGTILRAVAFIIIGVGGAALFYYVGNLITERVLPRATGDAVRPYIFILPAMFVVFVYLLYPMLDTIRQTFYGDRFVDGERPFVGLENYQFILTDSQTWSALWNNVLWLIFVPAGAVAIGLLVAVLADKQSAQWEKVSKSVIFMPMAISFVGASVVWGLVYDISTTGSQIGILNAVIVDLFGGQPVAWLEEQRINDFALMVIMIWLQAGFAMVLLSAAIKGVPDDTLEAARIDGANEWQVFWKVVVPQIRSTIVVVLTTILILVLKVFDIVRVLTNGRNNTQVVANLFYTYFENGRYGSAGVLVVLLVIATIPFMYINIRRFREQEALR